MPSETKPKPTPVPTPTPAVTADGLKAVLARIAAASNESSAKKTEDKPPVSTLRTEATVSPNDHRTALRSALGSVLEADLVAPSSQSTVVAPVLTPKKPEVAEVEVPPESAYSADKTEPDIKVLKKILGNDARVKSPFQ